VIQFKRRFFPERRYRLPMRWLIWALGRGALSGFAAFMKLLR
jgi:hypothetical protein